MHSRIRNNTTFHFEIKTNGDRTKILCQLQARGYFGQCWQLRSLRLSIRILYRLLRLTHVQQVNYSPRINYLSSKRLYNFPDLRL